MPGRTIICALIVPCIGQSFSVRGNASRDDLFWFVMAPPGVGLILVLARLYDRGLWPVYFPQRKLEQLFQVSSVHR
jgi:hypothetical protein